MALDVAKQLVTYIRRPGSQAQFGPLLPSDQKIGSKCELIQEYLKQDLASDHTAVALGKRFNMSTRNLSRIFQKEYGLGPIEYLTNARLDAARRDLELAQGSISAVARKYGFKTLDAFRRAFISRLGITPQEYRDRFRSGLPVSQDKK